MALNPALLFLLVWFVPLTAPMLIEGALFHDVSSTTQIMIVTHIAVFFLFVVFFWVVRFGVEKNVVDTLRENLDVAKFERITIRLFQVWVFTYVMHIIYSRGFPLYWVLSGSDKGYADFGIPTLGGMSNMLRAFILGSCLVIVKCLDSRRKKKFVFLGAFLLASAFVLETGRGNGVVLLLHPVGLYLLMFKVSIKRFFVSASFLVFMLFVLGGIQVLRYQDGIERLEAYVISQGFEVENQAALLLIPSLIYISVPLINADLNIAEAPPLKFEPYYSVQGIVPTVVRNFLFEAKDYGVLTNASNNVTSMYTPIIRDFGSVGAFLVVSMILFIWAYTYSRARGGSVFFILLWPTIFMCVALSFFNLYFTSLVVLMYPVLTYFVCVNSRRDGINAGV